MKKQLVQLLILIFLITNTSGFGGEVIETTAGVYVIDRTIEDEGFVFRSTYTKGHNFDATVRESRSLLIEMEVIFLPPNVTLFVNQVWAEATIASKFECIDRHTIDTMNDKPEGGAEQLGWWVDQNHSYVEEWFIGRFVNTERQEGEGSAGHCEIGTDLGDLGYLGTILQVDYDFYVLRDENPYAYKFSFVDNINLSKDGELVDASDIAGGNQNAGAPAPFLMMITTIPILIIFKKKFGNLK